MKGEDRGEVKGAFGKATGDAKTKSGGKVKVRNAVGGVNDALQGK